MRLQRRLILVASIYSSGGSHTNDGGVDLWASTSQERQRPPCKSGYADLPLRVFRNARATDILRGCIAEV